MIIKLLAVSDEKQTVISKRYGKLKTGHYKAISQDDMDDNQFYHAFGDTPAEAIGNLCLHIGSDIGVKIVSFVD